MASIDDIQNSEKLLDLSNKIVDAVNERRKLLKKIDADEQLHLFTIKQQQKLSQDIAANAEKYLGYQIKSKDLDKQIKASKDNIAKSILAATKSINGQLSVEEKLYEARKKAVLEERRINQDLFRQKGLLSQAEENISNLENNRQIAIQAGHTSVATALQQQIVDEKITAKNQINTIERLQKQSTKQQDIAKSAKEIYKSSKETREAQAEELAFLEKNLIIRKRIEQSTGLLGGLSKSLSKIPGIGQYLNADEAIDEMEKLAAKFEEAGFKSTDFGNRLQIGLKGASVLAKGFYENLKSPEAVFMFFASAINKADQQATKLAKSFGIVKDEAFQLRENFVQYSRAVGDNFINTDRLFKAQSELSEQLGIAVQYSNEELDTFSRLTEIVGLSADEAGRLTKFSAAAGLNNKDYVASLRKSAFFAQITTGTHFSDKEILQDISKLSAGILTKFQNNPKAIAAAVVQVKALGLSLEQVDKVGESLLNFESSIENQLKAQLLTGKQLNLEQARYLALTGSQAELSKEIASQAGSLAEFESMNVIAQKSLAEAFGMSRDELADMLMKQEAITKYGSKAAELNEEQLEYMKKHNLSADEMLDKVNNQRSVQEKFNDAMLKLQDIVGNLIAGPFGALLDMLSNILNVVGLIGKPFTYFGNIIDTLTGKTSSLGSVFKGILATVAAIGMIINPLGTLAALAAGGAAIAIAQSSGATKFADGGIVTSPITNATVGEAGPEAIIPLNSPKANSMMGGMDLTPMINAINEVRTAVTALANRPINSTINIDGKAIGTAVGKQQETGTAQNIYTGYQMA
jgi:hypothetical protein